MTTKGIIFSAPMVRALLAGHKTQTRRLITPRNDAARTLFFGGWTDSYILDEGNLDWRQKAHGYAIGDRLYVREAAQEVGEGYLWIYRADYPDCVPAHFENVPTLKELTTPWSPSIHMPRRASRMWLEVTDVREQRVSAISGTDAVDEGVRARLPDNGIAVAEFMDLWNGLHNKPGERWEDAPWVVALTFEVHRGNIDRVAP